MNNTHQAFKYSQYAGFFRIQSQEGLDILNEDHIGCENAQQYAERIVEFLNNGLPKELEPAVDVVLEDNDIETKKRFFALYFGQQVAKCSTGRGNICAVEGHTFGFGNTARFHLRLKSLSDITAEDALQVFSMHQSLLSGHTYFEKATVSNEILGIEVYNNQYQPSLREIHLPIYNLPARTSDFLRSRGYLLPFGELSIDQILERRWVKLNKV